MNSLRRTSSMWTVGLLITCLLAILASAGAAVAFLAVSVGLALAGDPGVDYFLWSAAGFATVAATLTAPAYFAGRSLLTSDRLEPARPSPVWLSLLAVVPVSLLVGWLAYDRGVLTPILGGAALAGVSVAPVAATIWLVRRLGPPVSGLRSWGQIATGLTWMPAAALAMEFAALLPLMVALGYWLLSTQDGAVILSMLEQAPPGDLEAANQLLEALVRSPLALVSLYGYIALVVPAIEEAVKTMAVWPFLRRGMSPALAFLGGALGGAGYALFEALFLSQPGEGWLVSAAARTGATLLHSFTAGFTSLGLSEALRRRQYALVALAYAASVVFHSVWNLAAVTQGLASVPLDVPLPAVVEGFAPLTAPVLTGLSLASLAGLVLIWRGFRPSPVPD